MNKVQADSKSELDAAQIVTTTSSAVHTNTATTAWAYDAFMQFRSVIWRAAAGLSQSREVFTCVNVTSLPVTREEQSVTSTNATKSACMDCMHAETGRHHRHR